MVPGPVGRAEGGDLAKQVDRGSKLGTDRYVHWPRGARYQSQKRLRSEASGLPSAAQARGGCAKCSRGSRAGW